jgi:hypothetical protein
MKRAFTAISIAVLWFGVCALQTSKQPETASISGVVTDTSGQLIPGVFLTAINSETHSEWQTRTTGDYEVPRGAPGKFLLTLLQPGKYRILAVFQGFRTVEIERTIAKGESAQLNITMQVNFQPCDSTRFNCMVDEVGPPKN